MEPSSTRWLILEQKVERRNWWPEDCEFLIWNENGIKKGMAGTTRGTPASEEICILFLPESDDPLELKNSYTHHDWQWNVWCHYGSDITMDQLKRRWGDYNRLSQSDKEGVIGSSSNPPLPFSASMKQKWKKDFNSLKALLKETVYNQSHSDHAQFEQFKKALQHLQDAWNLAMQEKGTYDTLAQDREALPIIVAGRYLLDALPSHEAADTHALMSAFSLCDNSSLIQSGNVNPKLLSERVRKAYVKLSEIIQTTINQSQPLNEDNLKSLRLDLCALIAAADLRTPPERRQR
jgi:hypothetical protein